MIIHRNYMKALNKTNAVENKCCKINRMQKTQPLKVWHNAYVGSDDKLFTLAVLGRNS